MAAPVRNTPVAAARHQVHMLLQSLILRQRNRRLMNHQHLLVLQVLLRVRQQSRLHTVLDRGLRLVPMVPPLPHDRCRQSVRQVELERDREIARIQRPLKGEANCPIVYDRVAVVTLASDRARPPVALGVPVVLVVVVPVAALLLAFDAELEVVGVDLDLGADVDFAEHLLAGVVEGLVRLDVQVAALEFASAVDVSHSCGLMG